MSRASGCTPTTALTRLDGAGAPQAQVGVGPRPPCGLAPFRATAGRTAGWESATSFGSCPPWAALTAWPGPWPGGWRTMPGGGWTEYTFGSTPTVALRWQDQAHTRAILCGLIATPMPWGAVLVLGLGCRTAALPCCKSGWAAGTASGWLSWECQAVEDELAEGSVCCGSWPTGRQRTGGSRWGPMSWWWD